uniref:Uncharacterized protein n=1 Tax=Rhizophora mucronata TaxID=61149 RepID=A0A2P2NNE0_RHIMU
MTICFINCFWCSPAITPLIEINGDEIWPPFASCLIASAHHAN